MQKQLRKLYYDPKGFQSAQELLEQYNAKYDPPITLEDAKSFIKAQYINQIHKPAKSDLYGANARFNISNPNQVHIIDVLSVYKDKKTQYKYIFALVDAASRFKAAQPLKAKSPADITKAIQTIYSDSKYLKPPNRIIADSGTEFKGVFAKYCEDNDITLQISPPNHHRPQGHVEVFNAMLAKELYKRLDAEEEPGYDPSWPANLQSVVERFNSRKYKSINMRPIDAVKLDSVKQPVFDKKKLEQLNRNEFNIFDRVRYLLPRDDPEFGLRRRVTDPTWSTGEYEIYQIIELPNNPKLYYIRNDRKTIPYGFTSIQITKSTEDKE